MEIFAQRIKLLRKEKKVGQKVIAEYLGIVLRSYQNYESGTHYPDVPKLIMLADYFGVSTDYLLGRSDQR